MRHRQVETQSPSEVDDSQASGWIGLRVTGPPRSLTVMAEHTYEITWSKQGDHADEDPRKVRASEFRLKDGIYEFSRWDGEWSRTVLTIRQSDVSMVEEVDE